MRLPGVRLAGVVCYPRRWVGADLSEDVMLPQHLRPDQACRHAVILEQQRNDRDFCLRLLR